jgi:hypothetical protein
VSKLDWYYGTLREDFGPMPAGTEVFLRKMTTRLPLAAGGVLVAPSPQRLPLLQCCRVLRRRADG